MPISKRYFLRSTTALLVVGLLALLGIVGMTYWLTRQAQLYFNEVIVARDASSAAADTRAALQTAESSQRGFLVTGNEIYLAPFDVGKTLALRRLKAIKRAFVGYQDQTVLIERISSVVDQKISEMDTIIMLKRARRDEEALELFRTNRGKALMDEFNVLISGAISVADAHLTQGVSEHRRNADWLNWFAIVGGLIIILVISAATLAVLRYTRDLATARDEVDALNAGLEERVRTRTAQLAQATEEVQRFAYIVTHDLRAPLVNIMGFTSELEAGVRNMRALIEKSDAASDLSDAVVRDARLAANEDLPEAIGFIRSSTNKMDGLINAILRIAREGRRTLKPESIDIAELVKTCSGAIGYQLYAASGVIETELKAEKLTSDRPSLEQVLGNLLDNAVKYRDPGRALRIKVTSEPVAGNRIRLTVADNGRGIAEQDKERVFEMFRRAGMQDQPGEGIGLAYVRALVQKLGGQVTVTSTLGTGTEFDIVLPRTVETAEPDSL